MTQAHNRASSWIRRDWKRFKASAVSTKAQTLSSFVSAIALIIIALQYRDNHTMVELAQRQFYMTSRLAESGTPEITAFTAKMLAPPPVAGEENAALIISIRNLGSAAAVNVTANVAANFTDSKLGHLDYNWDDILPGEPVEASFVMPWPYLEDGSNFEVIFRYRRMSDGPSSKVLSSCSRFVYSSRRGFVREASCLSS